MLAFGMFYILFGVGGFREGGNDKGEVVKFVGVG
jgi:hypothetical protein